MKNDTTLPKNSIVLRELQRRIGRNILDSRQRQHLTLEKLSKRTGFTADRLDRYELGKNTFHFNDLITISRALNVKMDTLLHP